MEQTFIDVGDTAACLLLLMYGAISVTWLFAAIGDRCGEKRRLNRRRASFGARRGRRDARLLSDAGF